MSNMPPLEIVGRGSETQLQVGENLNSIAKFSSSRVSYGNMYVVSENDVFCETQ